MPVFPAIFERVAGNLLSVDRSATQLPAILLAILLGVDAPLICPLHKGDKAKVTPVQSTYKIAKTVLTLFPTRVKMSAYVNPFIELAPV